MLYEQDELVPSLVEASSELWTEMRWDFLSLNLELVIWMKLSIRAGEMTQWTKCLLHKHDNQNLDTQTHTEAGQE